MNPMENMQTMLGQLRQFMGNPTQFLMQRRLNIPQNLMNDPNAAIQHLMNTGQMSQQQYNQLSQMAQQLQNNPQFKQIFKH